MHIGLNCYEYPPCKHGGVGSFTKDLAESLVKRGHNVTVFGFYFDVVSPLDQKIEEKINGVEIIRLPQYKKFSNNRFNFIFSRIKLYYIIKKLHKKSSFDVIESPEGSGWLPFGTPSNIPFITRLHGGQVFISKAIGRKVSTLARLFEKRQLLKSDSIIAVSKYVGEETIHLQHIDRNYTVIHNSIDDDFMISDSSLEINENFIVFSGSINPKKGVEELMIAMNIVMKQKPNAKLLLAGKNFYIKDGEPYEKYLRSLVDNKYNERIIFLGTIDRKKELIPLIKKAHVCCFPSYIEAFSLAPLEAMAIGKAVVNTKLASGGEAIVDGESGLLCDPKDPLDIAKKILIVLDDVQLASKLGKNAKKRIQEKFNFNKWIDANIEFYENIVKKR